MSNDALHPTKSRFSAEFWVALVAIGLPGLLWGGSMNSRMENVEAQQRGARVEMREDLREINRKLDALIAADRNK